MVWHCWHKPASGVLASRTDTLNPFRSKPRVYDLFDFHEAPRAGFLLPVEVAECCYALEVREHLSRLLEERSSAARQEKEVLATVYEENVEEQVPFTG